jgi:HEAT repeat protein
MIRHRSCAALGARSSGRQLCTLALLFAGLFVPPAAAQISLPPKPQAKGNVAPYLVCSVCGERNYTAAHDGRRDKDGNPIAWCNTCKRDTSQRSAGTESETKKKGKEAAGGLRLPPAQPDASDAAASGAGATAPSPGAGPAAGANAAASAKAAPPAPAAAADDASAAKIGGAAGFIFTEVRKAQGIDDHIVTKAVESLTALGDPGLAAARTALADSEPTVIMTAARVLLHSSDGDDIELVKNRVRAKLPASVGAPLVDELAHSDPVRVSPRFLCELVDSPHAGVRLAADRNLRGHVSPDLLPALEPVLSSKRSESRLTALNLIAEIDDPAVTDLLLAHLADPSAQVASSCVAALAGRNDPALDLKLLEMAFKQRWILRESSYALVTIVEREDLRLKPLLDDTHVEPLLAGLQSSEPFIAGACATALAGIGFRSPHAKATVWLDQAVMDRLVFTVSGKEFHNDFTALATPALRRLRLLTGQDVGKDGPRWVEWWVNARAGFFARRACIEIEPGDEGRIALRYQARGDDATAFALIGPALAAGDDAVRLSGELLYLTTPQARDLLALLQREGVFTADKLPGTRGLHGVAERTLEVTVAGRGKSFTFGGSASEPWFERAVSAARSLRDTNRWQRYFDSKKYASSLALWRDQSEWWASEHTPRERALRLKSLVVGALPGASGAARDACVDELARLYADDHVAEPADFVTLIGWIDDEPFYSERAHKLVRLALDAARSVDARAQPAAPAGAPATEPPQSPAQSPVPIELARDLIDALNKKFHAAAAVDLVEIARAAGHPFARELARDPRPLLRAVAAAALCSPPRTASGAPQPAAQPDEQDLPVLMKLLDDKERDVEIAAVLALGEHRVESARTELLVRARLGATPVRVAALQAIGKLGGEFVLEALALAASDPDVQVRVAAAKGLAELADPSSIQLFIAMLAEGRDGAVFEPVHAALMKLGKTAWPDLMRVAHTPGHRARREAAFLLSEQAVPEAASALMTMLTTTPNDAGLANELAVLTCVDFRGQPDPPTSWWNWWDGVVHDDSLAWFLGALERAGIAPPEREAFAGGGTPQGRQFLCAVMSRQEPHLVERARRELSRLVGRDLGEIPPRGSARDAWLVTLRESLQHPREQ